MQQRKYQNFVAVKQAVCSIREQKYSDLSAAQTVIEHICSDLKLDEADFAKNPKEDKQQYWILQVLAHQKEWQRAHEAFKAIADSKNQITLKKHTGSIAKLGIPRLLSDIPNQMRSVAEKIQSLSITEGNIESATVLIYILLAQKQKAKQEDEDNSREGQEKTQAMIKYSAGNLNRQQAFKPVDAALITLVNTNPLLRARIPDQLVQPSVDVIRKRQEEQKRQLESKYYSSESEEEKLTREINRIVAELEQEGENLLEIGEVKEFSLEERDSPNFTEDEIKKINSIDEKQIIKFDRNLAKKCKLTENETAAWRIASDARYGSHLNPRAQLRYWASGYVGSFFKSDSVSWVPEIVPVIEPLAVMSTLKRKLIDSRRALEKPMKIASKLVSTVRIGELNQQLTEKQIRLKALEKKQQAEQDAKHIEDVLASVQNFPKSANEKIQLLLTTKKALSDLKIADHKRIVESTQQLDAQIDQILDETANTPGLDPNPETRYLKLNEAESILRRSGPNIRATHYDEPTNKKIVHHQQNLDVQIQQARIQKTWDTTFEVYKYGEKEQWWNYFLGVPKDRGKTGIYILEWIIYLPPFFGCLFVPAKNVVKLFTEFFAKRFDAYCENMMENASNSTIRTLAQGGHYLSKAWWVSLRPITSPIVSAKAAWVWGNEKGKEWGSPRAGKILGATLACFSLAISFVAIVVVMSIAPKAFFSMVGQAGGPLASFSAWVSSTTQAVPLLPPAFAGMSPMNIPILLSNPARRQIENRTHAYLGARLGGVPSQVQESKEVNEVKLEQPDPVEAPTITNTSTLSISPLR